MSGKGKSSKKQAGAVAASYVYKVVTEIEGDLWTSPKSHSIAHCVAEDLRMGAGIAVGFKQNFKGVDDLEGQRKRVGHVAILNDEERFIYYLVTKKKSNGKPIYDDLNDCLVEMKEHCVGNNVKYLSMPRIGCGLDRLEWKQVKPMIEEIFTDAGVAITIYNFQQGYGKHEPKNEALVENKATSPAFNDDDFNIADLPPVLPRVSRNQEKKALLKEQKEQKKCKAK